MSPITPYCWRRRIAMRDVDAFGVVWYGNYLVMCDEARAELLRAVGLPPAKLLGDGWVAPVVELEARYLSPARHDEEVDVHVRIPEARGTKLVFEFTIRRTADAALLAKLRTTLVLLRSNGELVYLLPDSLKGPVGRMIDAQPAEAP